MLVNLRNPSGSSTRQARGHPTAEPGAGLFTDLPLVDAATLACRV